METTQFIAQITLVLFIAYIIFKLVRKRKYFPTPYDYYVNLIATIILTVWLLFAGAFDKLIG